MPRIWIYGSCASGQGIKGRAHLSHLSSGDPGLCPSGLICLVWLSLNYGMLWPSSAKPYKPLSLFRLVGSPEMFQPQQGASCSTNFRTISNGDTCSMVAGPQEQFVFSVASKWMERTPFPLSLGGLSKYLLLVCLFFQFLDLFIYIYIYICTYIYIYMYSV